MCRLLVILLSFIMVACSSSVNQPIVTQMNKIKKTNPNEVLVEDIGILMTELFPIEVNIIATGKLPNGCTTIDQITEDKKGDTLILKIIAKPKKPCSNQAQPNFAEVIPLDVDGLTSGLYKIQVNNKIDSFELAMDNIIR
ncbi:MAG: hypothetical protein KAG43_08915 [Candidatus Marithrix sp.]|nr:hypothetical protein [Candidatus Marithrix sp.]